MDNSLSVSADKLFLILSINEERFPFPTLCFKFYCTPIGVGDVLTFKIFSLSLLFVSFVPECCIISTFLKKKSRSSHKIILRASTGTQSCIHCTVLSPRASSHKSRGGQKKKVFIRRGQTSCLVNPRFVHIIPEKRFQVSCVLSISSLELLCLFFSLVLPLFSPSLRLFFFY